MIKVYVMKYFEGGRHRWFSESMNRDMAFEIGRRFGILGRKPVIQRIDIEPRKLLLHWHVKRAWEYPKRKRA